MNFRWEQDGNKHYLYFGKHLLAFKIIQLRDFFCIYCMLSDNVFGFNDTTLYSTDIETVKKSVEDLIRNFCIDFNIWYMR